MNTITDWPLSLEQFETLPEADPHLEFDECAIEGPTVSQKMPPTTNHQLLELWLVNWLNAQERGRALHELRVRSGRRSRVPDVSYWPTELVPRGPDGRVMQLPDKPPTLAIEIRSPGEDLAILRDKCNEYLREGSWYALIIDPTGPVFEVIYFENDAEETFQWLIDGPNDSIELARLALPPLALSDLAASLSA